MKYNNILPAAMILTLLIISSTSSINRVTARTPMDDLVLYMIPDNPQPFVYDLVNLTIVFKHELNTTSNLYNATLKIQSPDSLNNTNVFGLSSNMTNYNLEEYHSILNNTEALFWWDNSHINVTWGKFEPQRKFVFWYIVNITDRGLDGNIGYETNGFTITAILDNETQTWDGQSYFFRNIISRPEVSFFSKPLRGELTFYWWLAGSVLIVVPIIVIVITRLTLWKR